MTRRLPIVAFVTGLVAVTALGLLDLVSHISIVGGLMIGSFIAALAAPPVRVAIVGGYACGWAVLLGYDSEYWTRAHWLRIALVVLGTAIAVGSAISRDRYLAALVRTTNVAEVTQQALLRPLDERYDDTEVAVRYLASADGALVGGDVYDAEVTPWGLRVLIADVCGHGLESVDKASTIVFAFREAAHVCTSLREIVEIMDLSFRRRAGNPDFATCLILQVNEGSVELANCGHPDPLVVASSSTRWIAPAKRSPPLGLDPDPHPHRFAVSNGETLLAYTDGLVETRNVDGSCFDLERVALEAFGDAGLEDGIDSVISALQAHADGLFDDDVVLMAIRPATL